MLISITEWPRSGAFCARWLCNVGQRGGTKNGEPRELELCFAKTPRETLQSIALADAEL